MRPTDLRLLATKASLLSLLISALTVISPLMTPSAVTVVASGPLLLKAILTPSSADYATVTATQNLFVTRRSGGRQ